MHSGVVRQPDITGLTGRPIFIGVLVLREGPSGTTLPVSLRAIVSISSQRGIELTVPVLETIDITMGVRVVSTFTQKLVLEL